MDILTALKKVKKKGLRGTAKYCLNRFFPIQQKKVTSENETDKKIFQILLLTNRDSDNVGDQVIEACDIGLIKAVMRNLNIDNNNYKINSRAAAIISQKYLATKDERLLKTARTLIEQADLVVFGGAPLFNYLYQNFYERTAVTLEIAEEFHTPVIFSAIGVERYEEKNTKCQRLKKTLNFDCVKQITTRDGLEFLEKYKEKDELILGKVSDPAVFTSTVFGNYITQKKTKKENKKIGIFILRANGFIDNRIDFSKEKAAVFWGDLIREIKNRNYDYDLITSGHFGDEAFLDYLIRNYDFEEKKCIFNMNTPEKLIEKISSYYAVISCRLHPSIIAYSLNVPSVGIVWNSKVPGFYNSIGYGDRTVSIMDIDAKTVLKKIEQAMDEGIKKDRDFLMSVYVSLFHGIKEVACRDGCDIEPYSYDELLNNISAYSGTTEKEQKEKLKRKFRRTYKVCNDRLDKNNEYKELIKELKEENRELREKLSDEFHV